jgi:hypothetical protein
MMKATASTAIASHLPALDARLDALATEPVSCLARLFWSITVAPGSADEIDSDTALTFEALSAAT